MTRGETLTKRLHIFPVIISLALDIATHTCSSICNYTWIFIKSILCFSLPLSVYWLSASYLRAPEISISLWKYKSTIESFFEKGPHTSFSIFLSLYCFSRRFLTNSRQVTCPRLITQDHVSFALTDPNQAANNNHVNSVSEGLPESGAKTFYENLPFHGIQAPPNKVSMENRSVHEHPSVSAWSSSFFFLFIFRCLNTRCNRPRVGNGEMQILIWDSKIQNG